MTEKEVKAALKKNNLTWKHFNEWMRGQTVGLNEDGSADYYEYDVNRFIRSKGVYNHPEEWD